MRRNTTNEQDKSRYGFHDTLHYITNKGSLLQNAAPIFITKAKNWISGTRALLIWNTTTKRMPKPSLRLKVQIKEKKAN